MKTATTATTSPRPGTGTGNGTGTGTEVLVDSHWLATHLHDPKLRIVEVDVSPAAYNEWHIEGATLWNVYADLKDQDYRPVGITTLQHLIARAGIDPDSTVVFYGYAPALALWLMQAHGHRDVRILDCSRDTWRSAGHPCSTASTSHREGAFRLTTEPDSRLRADQPTVLDAIARPSAATVVDVRSAAEYLGECFWPSGGMQPDGRAGHVPSAVHQPIDGLYNADGSFREAAELRDVFSSLDLDGDEELITYCTIGGRAATAWFVLTHLLGRAHVRVYDGSWAEWGRTPGAPVDHP
jgi:thiosulfate/3-mercaptopyruvate sulfurtransferase